MLYPKYLDRSIEPEPSQNSYITWIPWLVLGSCGVRRASSCAATTFGGDENRGGFVSIARRGSTRWSGERWPLAHLFGRHSRRRAHLRVRHVLRVTVEAWWQATSRQASRPDQGQHPAPLSGHQCARPDPPHPCSSERALPSGTTGFLAQKRLEQDCESCLTDLEASHAWWIRSRSRRMAKVLGRGGLVDRRAAACVSRRPYLVARSGRSRAVASSSRRTALRPIEAVPMTCPVCSEVLDFEVKSEGGPVVGPPEKIACSSCKYEATNTSSFFDLTILPSEVRAS